jgi:hypothetical protein
MISLTGETIYEDCCWRIAIAYVQWACAGTFTDHMAELIHTYRLLLRGN